MPYDVQKYPAGSHHPNDISFRAIEGKPATPDEAKFAAKVNVDCMRLNWLAEHVWDDFEKEKSYQAALHSLYSAALAGVGNDVGVIDNGERTLTQSHQRIMTTVGRKYVTSSLVPVALVSIVLLVISVGLLIYSPEISATVLRSQPVLVNTAAYVTALAYAWIGCSLALMLNNLWRAATISWDNFEFFDPAGIPPAIRALGVILLVIMVMIVMVQKLIIIGLFSTQLNDFVILPSKTGDVAQVNLTLSFILGALCGFSEGPMIRIIQNAFGNPTSKPPAAPAT